jgi:hypothetical protein
MDLAVFVGFAAAGPLHLAVVVEDVAHFHQLFGDDVPLAWDSVHGRMVYGHLAPGVRAFFANGGRRCWVIRVAGETETNSFALPGMLELGEDDELRPAFAHARSAGSWFDQFQCGTALGVTLIDVKTSGSPEEFVAKLRAGDELQAGDLLRLRFPKQKLHFFVLVQRVKPGGERSPDLRSHSFVVQGKLLACCEEADPATMGTMDCTVTWTLLPAYGKEPASVTSVAGTLLGELSSPPSFPPAGMVQLRISGAASPPTAPFTPPPGSVLKIQSGGETLWLLAETVVRDADSAGATTVFGHAFWMRSKETPLPGDFLIAEKLDFEMRVRRGESDGAIMTNLGFAWENPRCWSALPDDDTLFDAEIAQEFARNDSGHESLRREAEENPLTGNRFPVTGPGNAQSVFLPILLQPMADQFPPAAHTDKDELTRDGLNDFRSALFLDETLIESSTNTLLADAEFIRYQRPNPRRLHGIHAALEAEEATLIAVPDAVHVGWKLSEIEKATEPQVSSPLPHPSWKLSDDCNYAAAPPTGYRPRYDKFLDCGLVEIQAPKLFLQDPPDGLGTFALGWQSPDFDAEFVLEEAAQPNFSDAREIFRGNRKQRILYGRRAGHYYYRVRAEAGGETSNWSNELRVSIQSSTRYQLVLVDPRGPEATADLSGPLLDIHRALLRLCAARGDLFALLALPEHFRTEEALEYVRLLKAPGRGTFTGAEMTLPIGEGESSAFSFGALYHPWVITREDDGEPLRSPPDGAACGFIARRSLERGAWIAPANEPFRGVIALNAANADVRRLDLLLAQVNQITQEPQGFLALNADTLSADSELRPINVRRLLILLRRAALQRGATYVFEPNGPALRRLVQHAFESLLDQLFVRGAFAGATRADSYQVVTDDSINTPPSMELGRFHVDLKVAPSLPMSFVTVRLVQTGERGVTSELL